jgi:hypothetical protein
MMHIVEPTKIVHGMYMHEPNDPTEIPSLYVFLSRIISLSILCMCLCLTIFSSFVDNLIHKWSFLHI